jgi:hypothetical protein
MSENKYIIMRLNDAKALASASYSAECSHKIKKIIVRIQSESGADIEDIATRLKQLPICGACSIESQESSCNCLVARQLGRRLNRLIDRANGKVSG